MQVDIREWLVNLWSSENYADLLEMYTLREIRRKKIPLHASNNMDPSIRCSDEKQLQILEKER